jgi:hypothetical protein
MSNPPVNVVFFGIVDSRPCGWYWTTTSEDRPFSGPFEAKAAAVVDAEQAANG